MLSVELFTIGKNQIPIKKALRNRLWHMYEMEHNSAILEDDAH